MAKLVTKFRYYKPGGRKKIGGYAKYIALRDGVERCDDSKKYASVSYNQKQLIAKILRDYPDSAEMLEYDDYKQHPTVGNASEFISRAIEDNAHSAMRQKTYADYIATRPRAEKVGSHGLFSDEDGEIVLSEVAADLNTHEGNVWTMIVSLRREDAERLGYNNARAWQMLLRSHTQELADALRIPLEDLKWYGAFHNESHHPHIHVIAYSDYEQFCKKKYYDPDNKILAIGDIYGEGKCIEFAKGQYVVIDDFNRLVSAFSLISE